MGVRRLVALGAAAQLVLLAFAATASAACSGDAVAPTDATTASVAAAAIVCDLDAQRADRGLPPLRSDARLASAAQRMADDMAARHYLSHVTPNGADLTARIRPTGYIPANPLWALAENLGWGTNTLSTPLATVQGWMASPAHRVNVLDPDMRDVGVGVSEGAVTGGGLSGTFYVADFGTRGTAAGTVHKRLVRARRSRHAHRHHRRR
jgi:uncharacterized protein YkwD